MSDQTQNGNIKQRTKILFLGFLHAVISKAVPQHELFYSFLEPNFESL
jgi:hypothetical protein